MRLLILILLFPFIAQGQIVRTHPYYRPTAAGIASYILDSISGAQTAYSLRKLKSTYSGSCIRIREAVSNNETDIGFSGDFLDTSLIKSFCATYSATEARVVKIYDQSGNGRDLSQTTASNQPYIYYNSSIERDGGKVAVYFRSGGQKLSTANYQAYPDSMYINFVMRVVTNQTYNANMNKVNGAQPNPLDWWTGYIYLGNGTANTSTLTSTLFSSSTALSSWTYMGKSTAIKAWRNNSSIANASVSFVYADGNLPLYVGSRSDGVTTFVGYWHEGITFNVISDSDLTKLHNNQIAYFSL